MTTAKLVKHIDLGATLEITDPGCLDECAPHSALWVDAASARLIVGVGQTLHAFDLRDGRRVHQYDLAMRELDPLATWCHLLSVTPDGLSLVAALSMRNGGESWSHMRVFDVASGVCVGEPAAPDHVMVAEVDPSGEVVACCDPWSVQLNRVSDGALVARVDDVASGCITWDPSTGNLLALEDDAVRVLHPRTLATLDRVTFTSDAVRALGSSGALHARANVTTHADAALPSLKLPWAVTLWADAPDGALLWVSSDGSAAVAQREEGIVWLRAGRAAAVLDGATEAERGSVDAAVSADGTLLAVHRGSMVTLRAIDEAPRPPPRC